MNDSMSETASECAIRAGFLFVSRLSWLPSLSPWLQSTDLRVDSNARAGHAGLTGGGAPSYVPPSRCPPRPGPLSLSLSLLPALACC
jgi:hypothetical protein